MRERRLWISTAAVVVAIYATLGLARTLSDEFAARRLFDSIFLVGFALIGVSIVVLAFGTCRDAEERHDIGLRVGVGLAIASVYIMVLARMGIPERTHLFEYAVVALLIHEALRERRASGRFTTSPALWSVALWSVILASFVGVLDECIQAFVPGRVFDPVDMGFNCGAAAGAIGTRAGLERIRFGRSRRMPAS